METPFVSIVIPTRDRPTSVLRLLKALENASSRRDFEVIVVDDGSTLALPAESWTFPVRALAQSQAGAAAARNRGARSAHGEILLFLDDDLEPLPGLIDVHAAAHQLQDDLVGLGDLPPRVNPRTFFGLSLLGWWEAMQDEVRRPGHRYTYQNLLSGHFSIRRRHFLSLGGFDETLRCREDYEFGWRTITAGLTLRFLPEAIAHHHDGTDLARACQRKFDEGIADVHLLAVHPELAPSLPLARGPARSRLLRLMTRLAWKAPAVGEPAVRLLHVVLAMFEAAKLRTRWKRTLDALLGYWYWRGVAQATGTGATLKKLLPVCADADRVLTLDLAEGFTAAERCLDERRPRAIRIVLGADLVGEVLDQPGAEALRGSHLKSILASTLRWEYLCALRSAGRLPPALDRATYPTPSGREPAIAR